MRTMRAIEDTLLRSFVFEPPIGDDELADLEASGEPWATLAVLVHRASQGDFGGIGRVEALMRSSDSYLFWSVATRFVGTAGPWPVVEAIAESLRGERHRRGIQELVSSMLLHAGNPAFAERMLELYEAAEDAELRDQIARQIGELLGAADVELGATESDAYPDGADDDPAIDYAALPYDELFGKVRDHAGYRRAVLAAQAAAPQPGPRSFLGHRIPG